MSTRRVLSPHFTTNINLPLQEYPVLKVPYSVLERQSGHFSNEKIARVRIKEYL